MGRRLILDTGVMMAAERRRIAVPDVLEPDDDAAIPAIVLAEFRVGILSAAEPHVSARQTFLEKILTVVPVLDYTAETAMAHARLLVHMRRAGVTRGAHDLVIAATAVATGRTILTTDGKAGFDELPGVAAIVV